MKNATAEATESVASAAAGAAASNTPDAPRAEPARKARRGFAAMSPEKQREIASKGGRASHVLGRGHEWSADEARAAGIKGGRASRGGRGKAVGQ